MAYGHLQAKVKSNQLDKTIRNVGKVMGENIPRKNRGIYCDRTERSENGNSERSKNLQQGKSKYEVGDTIEYTVKMRNSMTDSVIKC